MDHAPGDFLGNEVFDRVECGKHGDCGLMAFVEGLRQTASEFNLHDAPDNLTPAVLRRKIAAELQELWYRYNYGRKYTAEKGAANIVRRGQLVACRHLRALAQIFNRRIMVIFWCSTGGAWKVADIRPIKDKGCPTFWLYHKDSQYQWLPFVQRIRKDKCVCTYEELQDGYNGSDAFKGGGHDSDDGPENGGSREIL